MVGRTIHPSLAIIIAALASAPAVHADLTLNSATRLGLTDLAAHSARPSETWSPATSSNPPVLDRPTAPAVETIALADCQIPGFLSYNWLRAPVALDYCATAEPSPEVREFPPSPSSAALFLSAALSAGVFRLGRSARHWCLSDLPEWYADGGPDRIGHAVALDLDFNEKPLCLFQPITSAASDGLPGKAAHPENPPRPGPGAFLTLAAPRGPPTIS